VQTRRLGRTGHMSTIAIFGAAAFWDISQKDADATMETVLAAGVNHIDVAPSYGVAEERLGPWMRRYRDDFFLGCKTMERDAAGCERGFNPFAGHGFNLGGCAAAAVLQIRLPGPAGRWMRLWLLERRG